MDEAAKRGNGFKLSYERDCQKSKLNRTLPD